MRWRAIWPLAFLAALILAFAVGLSRDPRILPSELIDRPFPAFELRNLEDTQTLTRDDLVGQVSLVNVFGSWCVACEVEHPQLMALRGGPVRMIGIDWRDTRANANRWLARNGNPYDLIIFDPDSDLIVDLGVTGAPETFVIDASGNIRYKHVGIITPEDWAERLEPLVAALARGEDPS